MSELYDILVETPPTKVILLALDQGLWDCERSLNELAALCEANHMEAVASVTQKRQTPETGIVLGSGKLEEAAAAAAELGAECAVFDGELTGSQIRNISTALGGMEVIDRTMLILEIFRSRAVTNEGKLQTELALLRYRLPRLQLALVGHGAAAEDLQDQHGAVDDFQPAQRGGDVADLAAGQLAVEHGTFGPQLLRGKAGFLQLTAAQHDAGLRGLALLADLRHGFHMVGLAQGGQLGQTALTIPQALVQRQQHHFGGRGLGQNIVKFAQNKSFLL